MQTCLHHIKHGGVSQYVFLCVLAFQWKCHQSQMLLTENTADRVYQDFFTNGQQAIMNTVTCSVVKNINFQIHIHNEYLKWFQYTFSPISTLPYYQLHFLSLFSQTLSSNTPQCDENIHKHVVQQNAHFLTFSLQTDFIKSVEYLK